MRFPRWNFVLCLQVRLSARISRVQIPIQARLSLFRRTRAQKFFSTAQR